MNLTKIEWARNPDGSQGYTLNSKTGCLNHTPEGLCLGGGFPCYAYKLAHGRLEQRYLANKNLALPNLDLTVQTAIERDLRRVGGLTDPFYPRFWSERLEEPYKVKKPVGIFLDDMSDWMGNYWPEEWTQQELQMMKDNPQHRIYTLTKQPQNLPKWSPFPPNCFVGATVTKFAQMADAVSNLAVIEAGKRFISFEPLLGDMPVEGMINFLNQIIAGACTGKKNEIMELCKRYPKLTPMPYGKIWTAQPKIQWVEEIVRACDKAGIPVFLKNNLKPLLIGDAKWAKTGYLKLLRQELPK